MGQLLPSSYYLETALPGAVSKARWTEHVFKLPPEKKTSDALKKKNILSYIKEIDIFGQKITRMDLLTNILFVFFMTFKITNTIIKKVRNI